MKATKHKESCPRRSPSPKKNTNIISNEAEYFKQTVERMHRQNARLLQRCKYSDIIIVMLIITLMIICLSVDPNRQGRAETDISLETPSAVVPECEYGETSPRLLISR